MSQKKAAKAPKSAKSTKLSQSFSHLLREVFFIASCAVAVLLFVCLLGFDPNDAGLLHTSSQTEAVHNFVGVVGAKIADALFLGFGYVAYILPFLLMYLGWLIGAGKAPANDERDYPLLILKIVGLLAFFVASCGLCSLHFSVHTVNFPSGRDQSAGGALGLLIANYSLVKAVNVIGTTVILLALWCMSLSLFANLSWIKVIETTGAAALRFWAWLQAWLQQTRAKRQVAAEVKSAKVQKAQIFAENSAKKATKPAVKIVPEPSLNEPPRLSTRALQEQQLPLFKDIGTVLPPLDLLEPPRVQSFGYSEAALESLSQLLEAKLADFGIIAEVVHIQPGPVITRFEIEPEAGTKASKITSLARDLARSMSVVSVRVVEVISGKSTIGIEIPNQKREVIGFSEVVKAEVFENSKSPLTIGLGKNIGGKVVIADIAKMPHLLVAGTTGSGKSVALNAMLLSLLYKSTPAEVRLILIDPKMLELNIYEGIGHLLCPVVTDMNNATNALRWSVGEMERRYKLMSTLGVRNLAGFNKKVNDAIGTGAPIVDPLYDASKAFDPSAPAPTLLPMPLIVLVIDEFSDMITQVGKKAEELIVRLAQKARAAGIHVILATQRPSVDVVTGVIKANIPTRIAFQVSSKIDSRTILGQMGAEQLLGHGDMLYFQPGVTNVPERVHGAFVEDAEVHRVVAYLKSQGAPEYIDAVLEEEAAPVAGAAGTLGQGDYDPLYDEAVSIVTQSRKASISNLQRRLSVGFNRAASMIDMMEQEGVVSAQESNGARQVLAPPPPED